MPRLAGNEQYYNEIQIEMDKTGVGTYEAEVNMLKRVIMAMRIKDRKTHVEIAQHLQDVWGLSRGAYYTRLRWIRKRFPCP